MSVGRRIDADWKGYVSMRRRRKGKKRRRMGRKRKRRRKKGKTRWRTARQLAIGGSVVFIKPRFKFTLRL